MCEVTIIGNAVRPGKHSVTGQDIRVNHKVRRKHYVRTLPSSKTMTDVVKHSTLPASLACRLTCARNYRRPGRGVDLVRSSRP
jgi:hypothetical protein